MAPLYPRRQVARCPSVEGHPCTTQSHPRRAEGDRSSRRSRGIAQRGQIPGVGLVGLEINDQASPTGFRRGSGVPECPRLNSAQLRGMGYQASRIMGSGGERSRVDARDRSLGNELS